MKEYFIYRNSYNGGLNSSLLAKSLHQRLWDDSPYLLKQLPGIGMVTAKVLAFVIFFPYFLFSFRSEHEVCHLQTFEMDALKENHLSWTETRHTNSGIRQRKIECIFFLRNYLYKIYCCHISNSFMNFFFFFES